MDDQLREMLDHHQIRKTLSTYCHGCDRCDADVMASVYLEDSWDDHGIHAGSGVDFTRHMIAAVHETTNSLHHLLGQSLIKVAGDDASAETYFLAVSTSAGENGQQMCNQLGGRFVDELRRETGRWFIRHRTVLRDWAVSFPIEADWTAGAGLKDGTRTPTDIGRVAMRGGPATSNKEAG